MYTEKVRIYPNKTQKKVFDDILQNCRKLYNHLLELDIESYKTTKTGIIGYALDKPAKEFIGKEIPAVIRQDVCNRLTDAFRRFFKHITKFPKFKSENRYLSFGSNRIGRDGYRIFPLENKIQFPKLGKIKAKFTREIYGTPKTIHLKRCRSGKYYAFIAIDDTNIIRPIPIRMKDCVGIDLGVSRFITTSDGNYINSINSLKRCLRRLSQAQRELSRKKFGSNNREKFRLKVAKIYEKIRNIRRDFQFKVAYQLVHSYDHIVCENLDVSDMLKNKSKSMRLAIIDQSFFEFILILEHMCLKYSCQFTKVDPYLTSQVCSGCGSIVKKELSDRIHICPHCGLKIDRDLNAAINILQRGMNGIAVGTTAGTSVPMLVEMRIPGVSVNQKS